MDQSPGSSRRVVVRATAIIQDQVKRFLLTFHEEQGHYFLPGGKAKDRHGNDLVATFTQHPKHAAAYIARIFAMSSHRESARDAGVREVWEELLELKLVSPMRWRIAKRRFTIVDCPDAIKITNMHDAHARYRPEVDTENVILPCRMRLPRKWENEIQGLWSRRDPRIWYASAAEIFAGGTVQARPISPDVAAILVRVGLITPPHWDRDSRESTSDNDSDDSEEPSHKETASA